jgi:hypothetical protein
MPVHQAYAAVIKASGAPDDLRWQFKGDLSQTVMPGAAFSAIPVKMAAAIVVAAAGLVPPSGAETIIARKGSADLSVFITSDPSGGWAGYGPSLASYKGFHGVWRYFINASIDVPSLLKAFLPTSTSFVIDDRRAGKDSPAPRASVRLMNVTLDEALDAILGPTGYTSTKRNGVYMIRQGAGSAAATTTQPSRKRKGNK